MLSLASTMTRFLKIVELKEIPRANIDGHKFNLFFEIGHMTGTQFQRETEGSVEVVISGTLQAVWGVPDNQIQYPTGTAAAAKILEQASVKTPLQFEPIHLNTFSATERPPTQPQIGPGALIPIPDRDQESQLAREAPRLSIISSNISEIRDFINTISEKLIGDRLLLLLQERPLLDIYKDVRSPEEYSSRIQSLAGLTIAINKEAVGKFLGKEKVKDIGSLNLIEELLNKFADSSRANSICTVFKRLSDLRNGYPAHGDYVKRVVESHDFFKISYPVEDFSLAWDTILGKYFEAMKEMMTVLKQARDSTLSNSQTNPGQIA